MWGYPAGLFATHISLYVSQDSKDKDLGWNITVYSSMATEALLTPTQHPHHHRYASEWQGTRLTTS